MLLKRVGNDVVPKYNVNRHLVLRPRNAAGPKPVKGKHQARQTVALRVKAGLQ